MALNNIDFFYKWGMKLQNTPAEYFEKIKEDNQTLTLSSLSYFEFFK
jgi:hypothetical protein